MIGSNIIRGLGEALLKAGAPLLKDLVLNVIPGDGVGDAIAGTVIDALAKQLGLPEMPRERAAEKITETINANPEKAAPVVRQVEDRYIKTLDMGTGSLERYTDLLIVDSKSEGILSRLWRPLFAVMYTALFAMQVTTACWLMWTRQLGTLTQLGELVTFLTFMNVAACAVLGIQVWKRTEEKKQELR